MEQKEVGPVLKIRIKSSVFRPMFSDSVGDDDGYVVDGYHDPVAVVAHTQAQAVGATLPWVDCETSGSRKDKCRMLCYCMPRVSTTRLGHRPSAALIVLSSPNMSMLASSATVVYTAFRTLPNNDQCRKTRSSFSNTDRRYDF